MPTPQLRVMRRLHAPPPPSAWALATLVLGALVLWPVTGHAQTAALGGLEQLARDFVAPAMSSPLARTGEAPLRPEVVVGTLDTRLRLAPCNKVEAHLPAGTRLWGRSRIGLRCLEGSSRWNVFVPVTIKAFGPAWVIKRPVDAGATLTQEDAELAEVDWAASPVTVLARADMWVGQQTAFALTPGLAIRQNMVRPTKAFAAGDQVRVNSSGSGFSISVTGLALTAGLVGQSARIRLPGGRVVTGLVQEDQTVEMSL